MRALGNLGSGFFLTGDSVLVNLLGHRATDDLDLFTTDDAAMSQADSLARSLGAAVNAELNRFRPHPTIVDYLHELEARMRKLALPPSK